MSAEKRSRNKRIVSERHNTVVCSFDPKSPRISAIDIYEWIFHQLHVPENVVWLANLPPETPHEAVRFAFSQYGEIKEMHREVWSKTCLYKVFSGVRIVVIILTKQILSHKMIAGHRGLVSYEGQPTTCYDCGETGHFNQVCPKRRRVGVATTKQLTVAWADIAVNGKRSLSPKSDGGVKEKEADQQSIETGYGDEHGAKDEEVMQEDNTHSTGVTSEQSEEPERGAVGGSDFRNYAKAPCVDGRPGLEDTMDCGEEILGDTNATVECQSLLRQTQEDMSTTTEARDEEKRGKEKQEIRNC